MPAVVRSSSVEDLPAIRERGVLRALVSYSRTDFFLQGARPRGVMAELLRELQKHLNKGLSRKQLHTQIHWVVVPFNRLIPALLAGEGDIAAAFLTVTPEREKRVDFVTDESVDEVVVTYKGVAGVSSLDDLSGRVVHVLNGSSYAEHLRDLNRRLARAGKAEVDIHEADPNLSTDDLLELVNAGAMEITVSDDFRANLWAKVLPDIVVHEQVKVNEGGVLAWAVRKNNPELRESLDAFGGIARRGTAIGNTLVRRYFGRTKWIKNPVSRSEQARLDAVRGLFEKYAQRYGVDWVAMVAQAYQESGLHQSARSPAGAVGIMQLLPSTARDPTIGIADIDKLENNIHAGVKYVAFLRDHYFHEPEMDEADRLAFIWAAYNAGPGRVRQMRRRAEKMHLDPNRWFGNVELAALAMVGQETVRYVSNVFKYYVAYRTIRDTRARVERRKKAAGSAD